MSKEPLFIVRLCQTLEYIILNLGLLKLNAYVYLSEYGADIHKDSLNNFLIRNILEST
jgi:hypothetical protein